MMHHRTNTKAKAAFPLSFGKNGFFIFSDKKAALGLLEPPKRLTKQID